MRPPGGLDELGTAGRDAWDERYRAILAELAGELGRNPYLLPAPDGSTPWSTAPEWPGYPARVDECLGRAAALEALDRGARELQEEYLEWRVVRDGDVIRRVELTTELSDYWLVLAAHEPARAVELAAAFAGRPVEPEELFGAATTPDGRQEAFRRRMLRQCTIGPLNDGREAICCMINASNTLRSLLRLAYAATAPRVVRDVLSGRLRCLTCDEAIPSLRCSAVRGRFSDPVLVERLSRLAYEDRFVALEDPLGIYIDGVEHGRLRTPDGDPVPADWFAVSRGRRRLVLECPPDAGFAVGQLVDDATEQPIRHGGQVAELVRLVLPLRTSGERAVGEAMPDPLEVERAGPLDCTDVRTFAAAPGP